MSDPFIYSTSPQQHLVCRSGEKPVYKCANSRCPYGPHWDHGQVDPDPPDDERPLEHRADSYSQFPYYRNEQHAPQNGLCLNCYDDVQKEDQEDQYYP